jgi:hypothetical protein
MLLEQARIQEVQSTLNDKIKPNLAKMLEALEILDELTEVAVDADESAGPSEQVLHSFLEVEDYDSELRLNYYGSISSETNVLLTQHHTLIAQMEQDIADYSAVTLPREYRELGTAVGLCGVTATLVWNFTYPEEAPSGSRAQVSRYVEDAAVLEVPHNNLRWDLNSTNYTLIIELKPSNVSSKFLLTLPEASSVFVTFDSLEWGAVTQTSVQVSTAELYFGADATTLVVQQAGDLVYMQFGNSSALLVQGQTTFASDWRLEYSSSTSLFVKSIQFFNYTLQPDAFQGTLCTYFEGSWGSCEADCGVGLQSKQYSAAPSCPPKNETRFCQAAVVCPLNSTTPTELEFLQASTLIGSMSFQDDQVKITAGQEGGFRVHLTRSLFYSSQWVWDVSVVQTSDLLVNRVIPVNNSTFQADVKVGELASYIVQVGDNSAHFYASEQYSFDLTLTSSSNLTLEYLSLEKYECAGGCSWLMLGNSQCDLSCNTSACNYDYNDCEEAVCECSAELLGNHVCDEACFSPVCNFDAGDCTYCWPGCSWRMLDDGVCDQSCDNPHCFYDSSDCTSEVAANCTETCAWSQVGDKVCQPDCNVAACAFDFGDCHRCSDSCLTEWVNDGVCNAECNTAECFWDGNDCNKTSSECSAGCAATMLHNKVCDEDCQTEACGFDMDDCMACDQDCTLSMLESDICSPQCNTAACGYQASCSFCSSKCPPSWLKDGNCDSPCNVAACNYDEGDCLTNVDADCPDDHINNGICEANCFKPQHSYDGNDCVICQGECLWRQLGNGECDSACNIEHCDYDGGDCEGHEISTCAEGCAWTQVGDNICDKACDNSDCIYDFADCLSCSVGCLWYWVGDGICDEACNFEKCYWDGADCNEAIVDTQCAPGCEYEMVGNGVCNRACENPECYYDFIDCAFCRPGCPLRFMGDGKCDLRCLGDECHNDLGDCKDMVVTECAEGCKELWVGDGMCDKECNVEACQLDKGDCVADDEDKSE